MGQIYDYFYQFYIIKNVVLCSVVQKNFKVLSNVCDVVRYFVFEEEQFFFKRIQDIGDNQFFIFIIFKKLFLMFDVLLKGLCFFVRNDDGSLKVKFKNVIDVLFLCFDFLYCK